MNLTRINSPVNFHSAKTDCTVTKPHYDFMKMPNSTIALSHSQSACAILPRLGLALLLFAGCLPLAARAQVTPNPPDRMSYQGFALDANGVALGLNAPKNYDVIFRIWNDQTSTDVSSRLWAEQQTVTVDKGYFSVLLGEGGQYAAEPRPSIASLFGLSDSSDRYVEITVKGIGSGGADSTILPRLRLVTSPYSYLAQKAINAASLVNQSNVAVLSAAGNTLTVSGTVNANSFSGDGANLTNLTGLNASALTTGTVADARLSSNVAVRAGGNTFTGNQTVNSGSVTATSFAGDGTIPVGGIILWSGGGGNIPSGWALCNGQTSNGQLTPNLMDRFVVGAGSAYSTGNTGGSSSITLSAAQMPSHSHNFQDGYWLDTLSLTADQGISGVTVYYSGSQNYITAGSADGSGTFQNTWMAYRNMTTSSAGSSQPFDSRPPYYALAYIMRVR